MCEALGWVLLALPFVMILDRIVMSFKPRPLTPKQEAKRQAHRAYAQAELRARFPDHPFNHESDQ